MQPKHRMSQHDSILTWHSALRFISSPPGIISPDLSRMIQNRALSTALEMLKAFLNMLHRMLPGRADLAYST